MRFITKTSEPSVLRKWKSLENAEENVGWIASYENLQNPEKKELHKFLLKEQFGICCYCEQKVSMEDSHIEHLDPQSSHTGRHRTVDYFNLFVSCQRFDQPGVPKQCAKLRDNWDTPEFIKPTESDCTEHFSWTESGEIKARNEVDVRAGQTIRQLGLDQVIPTLKRAAVIEKLFEPDDDLETIRKLVRSCTHPNTSGVFSVGYPSMIEYLYLRT